MAKYFEAKGFEIVFFLGPQETHLKEDIINQIKKPMFPEEELSNFPGLEVVMGATKYLSMAITIDSRAIIIGSTAIIIGSTATIIGSALRFRV